MLGVWTYYRLFLQSKLVETFIANSWTRSPNHTGCVWASTRPGTTHFPAASSTWSASSSLLGYLDSLSESSPMNSILPVLQKEQHNHWNGRFYYRSFYFTMQIVHYWLVQKSRSWPFSAWSQGGLTQGVYKADMENAFWVKRQIPSIRLAGIRLKLNRLFQTDNLTNL